MKYQIDNLKVEPKDANNLENILKTKFKLKNFSYKIIHKSIDARNKNQVCLIYRLIIETNQKLRGKNITLFKENNIKLTYPKWNNLRPIIVGFGPAGMFAALYLARCNSKPIIIERGSDIEQRKRDVENFLNNKILNENSNIQFGEGGAGAFSDGKLVTNLRDPLINFILNEFYIHGAKEDVLYDAKPHVGTDYLEKVVKNIRLEILSLGGEFYFNHTFLYANNNDDGSLDVFVEGENNKFKTNHLLLGLGHSARDTIKNLYYKMNLNIEPKAFSMGVRIEHPIELINSIQYGDYAKYLPAAYYKLASRYNGRGVYTFCMCPGGYVMASTSDSGSIVTNGMSNYSRDNFNSNAAILVDVLPSDYYVSSPLDGLEYQVKYEKKAFNISKDYKAPANLVKEFLNDEVALKLRTVKTTYPHGVVLCDLKECLPSFVVDGIKQGIKDFDNKLKGFNYDDAILIGVETRSSSAVRIIRDNNKMANMKGVYPIGEGAGYAGGITSAALDGLKTAIQISLDGENNGSN